MFCPRCGISQSDDLKFCKQCGANLEAVRQAVVTRDASDKFDWGKTWVAEMFLSEGERKKREEELERQRGITPEVKRYNEIKAGVITSSVGVGVAIFLYVFMRGIILSGNVPPNDAEIIARLWVAGVIPFFVGGALIINGIFVSKQMIAAMRRNLAGSSTSELLNPPKKQPMLSAADSSQMIEPRVSVTENTTKHLEKISRTD
jgi:hypothetical protein